MLASLINDHGVPQRTWKLYYSLDCAAPTISQGFSFGFSKTSSPAPLPTSTSAGNWCRYHVGTGTTLEAWYQERIFKPLGMADTSYAVPADKQSRVSMTHSRAGGTLQEQPRAPIRPRLSPRIHTGVPRGSSPTRH